jgi:hypothetical protein
VEATYKAPSGRLLSTWILLLAAAQMADVITTGVDMARGGVEANHLVATLMSIGGLQLVFVLKLLLVLALAVAVLVLKRYADSHPSPGARVAHTFVWRAIQISVVGLVLVAVNNTALLAQIA